MCISLPIINISVQSVCQVFSHVHYVITGGMGCILDLGSDVGKVYGGVGVKIQRRS